MRWPTPATGSEGSVTRPPKDPAGEARRLPRRTVRLRLAVLYGSLFFVSGLVLLALVYGGAVGVHARRVTVGEVHPVEARPVPGSGSPR